MVIYVKNRWEKGGKKLSFFFKGVRDYPSSISPMLSGGKGLASETRDFKGIQQNHSRIEGKDVTEGLKKGSCVEKIEGFEVFAYGGGQYQGRFLKGSLTG